MNKNDIFIIHGTDYKDMTLRLLTEAGLAEQIKDRGYALRFMPKLGEKPRYTGRILAVGIAYSKSDPQKRHSCEVEVLREKI